MFHYPVVGFSGSRHLAPIDKELLAYASCCVPSSSRIHVGDAPGVDRYFRDSFEDKRVTIFQSNGFAKSQLVARSIRFVKSLRDSGGCLVSFPSCPCPSQVVASSRSSVCFCGSGSGSWASLAFAVGLGLPCFVALPYGVDCPPWLAYSSSYSESSGFIVIAPPCRQLSIL